MRLPIVRLVIAAVVASAAPAWLAGCAAQAGQVAAQAGEATAHPGDPAAAPGARAAPTRAIEVARGVYRVQGAAGEAGAENLGRIGNAGFIVGERGVLAIDTGTSYRHGKALLAAIGRVTDKPVLLALITHTRQEFLFGAAAYREAGIPIHMHRKAAGLMQSRCDRCLKTLKQLLGDDAMRGTLLLKPDHEFDASHTLEAIGRPVRVLYFGHSSGPGDVAVFDERSGVLFAGGLIDHERIPDVQDSEPGGWSQALAALRGLPIRHIVPGHGPLAPPQAVDATERYLAGLQARVRELLDTGAALSEVADAASLPEFAGWDQYDTIHRRNASVWFVRFERDEMFKRAGASQ